VLFGVAVEQGIAGFALDDGGVSATECDPIEKAEGQGMAADGIADMRGVAREQRVAHTAPYPRATFSLYLHYLCVHSVVVMD